MVAHFHATTDVLSFKTTSRRSRTCSLNASLLCSALSNLIFSSSHCWLSLANGAPLLAGPSEAGCTGFCRNLACAFSATLLFPFTFIRTREPPFQPNDLLLAIFDLFLEISNDNMACHHFQLELVATAPEQLYLMFQLLHRPYTPVQRVILCLTKLCTFQRITPSIRHPAHAAATHTAPTTTIPTKIREIA